MSHTQAKVDIEAMMDRISEKYESVYVGDGFNFNHREHGVELFLASSVNSVFYIIKENSLYKFWEGISTDSRVEFFTNAFKKDFFEFFEDYDKDELVKFLETISTFKTFKRLLTNVFCGLENEVMGEVSGDEFKPLYRGIVEHLTSLLEDIETAKPLNVYGH